MNTQVPVPSCPYEPAPFSDDPRAIANRNAIDFSVKISYEDALAGRNTRPIRVYGDGIYDMFHEGHARQLLQAKTHFPGPVYIIVGIPRDIDTVKCKGNIVMNEEERAEMLRHCRYVDEVIKATPYLIDEAFMQEHKIDFVAHDDLPYNLGDTEDIYKWLKDSGRFLPTNRTEGLSTSDIITRILRKYPPMSSPSPSFSQLSSTSASGAQRVLATLSDTALNWLRWCKDGAKSVWCKHFLLQNNDCHH